MDTGRLSCDPRFVDGASYLLLSTFKLLFDDQILKSNNLVHKLLMRRMYFLFSYISIIEKKDTSFYKI